MLVASKQRKMKEKIGVWMASDDNGHVYLYKSKPVYYSDEHQYQGEGAERIEKYDNVIKPGTCYFLSKNDIKDVQEKSIEFLEYFVNAGTVSITDALENPERIKKACFNLAKAFLESNE